MALYAFDGTWNDSTAPDEQRDARKDTNVHRFRVVYSGKREYVNGVGTRFGLIGKIVGGLTGAGAEQRITEQFATLKQNYAAGDTDIDVVGYSRGAAIARMFVQRIERDFDSLIDSAGNALVKVPQVRFLGLFDTVASFGIPWDANERSFKPDIPECVANTFHAMALDETRETFGIERCLGNRNKITEVWFRGGHGDVGGNATYVKKQGQVSNRERSDIALRWMISKAEACGLPIASALDDDRATDDEAPVTSRSEPISIGNVGTLSRRIHIGDLVHHTLEQTQLTRGIDGRMLRRINVPTRIENKELEKSNVALTWVVPEGDSGPDNVRVTSANPSIVELSSRRYPFDVLPARTWKSWLENWKLDNPGISEDRLLEFWAPQEADRGLAWDLYVELMTRITTQKLDDHEGDDNSALKSVYSLFALSRDYMHLHGVRSANTAALLTAYLNQKVRAFTAKWHKRSLDEKWAESTSQSRPEFRTDLHALQPVLRQLAEALSHLADARL